MNNKERLQEIKEELCDVEAYRIKGEIYVKARTVQPITDWLIKQAEKVEQLETDKEFFKKEYMQINEKYLKVLEQLQQAQAKAERYKNHLLCIQKHYGLPSEPTDFVPVTVLHEIQMIVNNALEDES
ncbi:hypothetical protein PT91_gp37 [Geobacillus phage vB_GthS_PT9.1]|nr:hypothetical protein PT91_gp37 [Geobacillus phage vB_GthS_PT9.1]